MAKIGQEENVTTSNMDDPFSSQESVAPKVEVTKVTETQETAKIVKTEVPQKQVTLNEETLAQILEANKNLQAQVEQLNKKIEFVSDTNKLRDFDDNEKGGIKHLWFSYRLYVDENENKYPVVKWRMKTNVIYNNKDTPADQIVEISYLDWEEIKTKTFPLIEMKNLQRVESIAKAMKNPDGSDVYFSLETNKDTGLQYHKIHPKTQFFDCIFNHDGKDITINSQFLNS